MAAAAAAAASSDAPTTTMPEISWEFVEDVEDRKVVAETVDKQTEHATRAIAVCISDFMIEVDQMLHIATQVWGNNPVFKDLYVKKQSMTFVDGIENMDRVEALARSMMNTTYEWFEPWFDDIQDNTPIFLYPESDTHEDLRAFLEETKLADCYFKCDATQQSVLMEHVSYLMEIVRKFVFFSRLPKDIFKATTSVALKVQKQIKSGALNKDKLVNASMMKSLGEMTSSMLPEEERNSFLELIRNKYMSELFQKFIMAIGGSDVELPSHDELEKMAKEFA